MSPGGVIVDLAAERGGNCELSEADQTVVEHGVTILGPTNLPSEVPFHASQMFSKNLATLLAHLVKEGAMNLDLEDEITRDTLAAHDGKVVNERIAGMLAEGGGRLMVEFVGFLTVFVLAMFVGFEVITKVPPTLHTPLTSGSNAVSGITIIGALIAAGAVAGELVDGELVGGAPFATNSLGFIALVLATVNVVGGFLVTYRMLQMFRKKN